MQASRVDTSARRPSIDHVNDNGSAAEALRLESGGVQVPALAHVLGARPGARSVTCVEQVRHERSEV